MENKRTQAEMFAYIAELLSDNSEVVDFCNDHIAKLANKAEKARAKAAEKKAIGDELYAAVCSCVGSDPITAEAVLGMLDGEDLTVGKVRARLSQGVKNGILNKETIKVDGKDKVHYTRA